jgi:oligopeptide/dipeptide ABC transporter ATP-binding protein
MRPGLENASSPILQVKDLKKYFKRGRTTVYAVDGVSFDLHPGETVGLVGESGSGKSTIGRLVVRLLSPTGGSIVFQGSEIGRLSRRDCRPLRQDLQFVFQNPWGALNPRMRIGRLIAEPLILSGASGAEAEAARIADRVQLNPQTLKRFPHELSGGQLQRVCIARAIATRPKVIILDEPTSSLDLSVRAEILNLLRTLQEETGAAFIFISHDLDTVKLISDRIIVLYLGGIVEQGNVEDVFNAPAHPYTQSLLSAHLPIDRAARRDRIQLPGEVPSPLKKVTGCSFAGRCPIALDACATTHPEMTVVGAPTHVAACLRIADRSNAITETAPEKVH